jgi:hypothetical protein
MGHPDEGAVYLNEGLKRDPNNGVANLGLARIAAARGKTSDAITYYHRAIYGSWPAGGENNRLEARFELAEYLKKAGRQRRHWPLRESALVPVSAPGGENDTAFIHRSLTRNQGQRPHAPRLPGRDRSLPHPDREASRLDHHDGPPACAQVLGQV